MARLLLFSLSLLLFTPVVSAKPNLILVVTDNLGYGDVGCFGSTVNRTPNLDRMAEEGIKLTDFYVGSSVCTPSRAAFMSGSYPARVSMELSGTRRPVIQPVSQKGLAPGEITVAEILKQQDYATMCIGKWHLGDQPQFLPTAQGFDSWLGVPYSEDMIATTGPRLGEMWPPLPLVRDDVVVDAPVDPDTLTKLYTEEALRFIREKKAEPFFLYLPHAAPGSSDDAIASDEFLERSQSGKYGACIEELDWSMGEIFQCLKEEGLDENTLVIWTSDNGAFQFRRVEPFGQNTPLAGTGGTAYEGGFRVPCIARWPGKIAAGSVSDELVTSMDLLPTLAKLAGGQPPRDRQIDGRDVWAILSGDEEAKSPHEIFYYYKATQLRAIRSGKWKLHLPVNTNASRPGVKPRFEKVMLFDLDDDLGETNNLAAENPEIVQDLLMLAETGRETLGDINRPGSEQRPAGWLDNAASLRMPGLPGERWFPSDSVPLITPGAGLFGWDRASANGWSLASSVGLSVDDPKLLVASTVEGDAVIHNLANPKEGSYLKTRNETGDVQVHLEFQMAEGSNSGVYLMGRYEVQLFDSWGKDAESLKYSDCGGIYEADDDKSPGVAPTENACRPPGEWQSLDIEFRAPRFDKSGAKIEDAMFVNVRLNGVTIHENSECSAPTRSAIFKDEADEGPLVLQGDHGPVAFRNIWIR